MKFKKILLSAAVASMFVIQLTLNSCPKCNQDFYNELLSKGTNVLGRQELLLAIQNQNIPGAQSYFNPPETFNLSQNELRANIDGTNNTVQGDNNETSLSKLASNYLPYILMFTSSLVTGQIV